MGTAFFIKGLDKEEEIDTKVSEVNNEIVTDECVDETSNFEEIEIEEANSSEEKTSPNCSLTMKRYYNECGHSNCSLTMKRYYNECGHSIEEYSNLNKELVNKTKDEIQEVYSAWNIDKFSNNEIIISRSFESQCGEHYVVRDKDGKVVIYLLSGDGTESELQETQISTEFLTETDKIELQNGIRANGKQELKYRK